MYHLVHSLMFWSGTREAQIDRPETRVIARKHCVKANFPNNWTFKTCQTNEQRIFESIAIAQEYEGGLVSYPVKTNDVACVWASSLTILYSPCLDGCQAGSRRLQPRHCKFSGRPQSQGILGWKHFYKVSHFYRLIRRCIVLHVCFVFRIFLWGLIFCSLVKGHIMSLAGNGYCLFMFSCCFRNFPSSRVTRMCIM